MWSIATMDFYSAIQNNEILPFVVRLINLGGLVIKEIIDTQRDEYLTFFLMCRD